jgi:hypothetical protein
VKETFARMLYERHCQCHILRFEERARECILVARANLLFGQPKRKQHVRNRKVRHDVYKCVESPGYDPKPGDLGVGRLKRGESYVEDRKRY